MQSRDDQTGECLDFARACLSELGFAKSNPEGRSGQFRFNSKFSLELAMSSVFDLSITDKNQRRFGFANPHRSGLGLQNENQCWLRFR